MGTLRKKNKFIFCVFENTRVSRSYLRYKNKSVNYNHHKIVMFDTLSYHIAFKINGDHFNAPQ